MSDRLSLSRAALRLNLTYHQVRALLLRGELTGGVDQNGRFWIDADGLERWRLNRLLTARVR